MHLQTAAVFLSPLALGVAAAQATGPPPGYAGNWRPLVKDDDVISQNFKNVDIELLSPAFLDPDGIPKGFTNGTSAATSAAQLGMSTRPELSPPLSSEGPRIPVRGRTSVPLSLPDQQQRLPGEAYFQSQLATGYDPNRDFPVMGRQQTRHLISLYTRFAPHIFLDCHEFGASWRFGKEGNLVVAADSEVHSMSGLNTHEDIFNIEYGLFVRNMAAAMKRNGIAPHGHYGLTHNSKRQAVAILIEARGVRLGDQHFQRRTAVDNADHVYQTIEDARQEFIASTDDIALTSQPRPENITWQCIDANNGSLVDVPVTYQNYTPPPANLTRSRPEAYVFTRAWADVADRLRIAGVQIEQLEFAFTAEVEALKVKTSTLADEKYEGIVKNTVTTSNFTRTVKIPAGGFWISTRQVNAAMAMSFLEPEDVASAVTYNIVPFNEGEEYPIYRVLKGDEN
ncbi:carboxypeptidase [Plectosphaerella plurivora]|uniref:Carboxypeptidase n=1 Tax=Plectosphaerella plurivora TaxID=936078 RepID=A0A9P8VLY0_9PEZI|nr:carboxypeptidase [Plectosphaerella plurivora]